MTETYIRAERQCSMDAALALLEIELSVDLVAEYTQLPVEEVVQLKQAGDLPEDIRDINVCHCGLDDNEIAKLRSRRKYLTDLVSDFATAYDRGVKRGRAEAKAVIIRNLMDSTGWDMEEAMSVLEVPSEERAEYRELLNG